MIIREVCPQYKSPKNIKRRYVTGVDLLFEGLPTPS